MKELKKTLFTATLLLIGILTFSSCSSDDDYHYQWRSTTLDIGFDLYTSNINGYAEVSTTVYIEEIVDFNPNREDLINLRTTDSWLILSNFERGNYIDRFYIDVEGVGTYSYEYPISIRFDGEEILIDDDSYFNFMRDVNNLLYYDGFVNMRIRIYTNIYDDFPVYFDIHNNLDIEVRR